MLYGPYINGIKMTDKALTVRARYRRGEREPFESRELNDRNKHRSLPEFTYLSHSSN